ncbi:pseudo-response regulator 5 [Striga hermonthica]|uniref:Pseudo-response regulator 5 n=1 Tax=Striga hermonthica TaxID=68872 RepID=A0A9N7N555_STRHE|nr:pseudo-response regulator 5 [Striga hermonthica]
MGEAVVSSEAGIEKQVKNCLITAGGGGTAPEVGTAAEEEAESSPVVRWDKFLPKMVLRVLLVEADDSTRQIIAALLRKCSYRVATVPDGLKAWEVLKGSSCNIDLILTEVELPSISGYALLTLIMEHEACKNIPVIMMSSQDSVGTVYKCMLRGASDFLVKPVRKNELRNLWQHVWRKQASSTSAGLGLPDESVQQKDETTAENTAISNHSSGCISCIERNKQCTEEGTDDQSSCTKPESETEGEDVENGHCSSKKQKDKCVSEKNSLSCGEEEQFHQVNSEKRSHENESREMHAVLDKPCSEAIDLIGAFDNHLKGNFGSLNPNVSANKFDILPLLDLSLRRPLHNGSANRANNDLSKLNHSDASAFSRYINKPSLPENHVGNPTIQTGCPEITFSYTQNKEIFHPIPVKGIRFDNPNSAYNSMMPSLYCAQSGSSSLSSPHTPHHTESFPQSGLFYLSDYQPASLQQGLDQKIGNSVNQTESKPENNVEDHSGNSNYCSSYRNQDKVHVSKGPSENPGREESFCVHDEASKRSMQREAALNKFRMKRKDRCFEKKVRYESRKKLAEQRPRVKGQFVRQVSNGSQFGNSSTGYVL